MPRQAELTGSPSRILVVAGILADPDGAVLIADRRRAKSMRGFWEFPGGKVADDEAPEDALRRELREELGIEVGTARHFQRIEHDYPEVQVAIDFYRVIDWQGIPAGCEGQRLKWVTKRELAQANLLPADAPVIQALNSPDE